MGLGLRKMHMGSRAEAFKKRNGSVSHHELLDVEFDCFSLENHVDGGVNFPVHMMVNGGGGKFG